MNKKTIAIYLGDPAGIGPEEVAKVAAEGYLQDKCNTLILGDERVFQKALALIGKSVDYLRVTREEDISFENHAICLYDLQDIDPEEITMGQIDARCGRTCIRQIDLGIELWRKHIIDGALFAAVNKAAVKAAIGEHYNSEFSYMIEALDFKGYASEVNHMDNIFTTRIVSHVPMRQMCDSITQEKVENAIRLLYTTMVKAGIENPRIAVAALNPHGGEAGTCGREEIDIMGPAMEAMRKEGYPTSGPYPADTVFQRAFRKNEFDGIVTMYHDQGQIALKLLGFEHAVSILGGLPMPVVTPAHGTAFEIAGQGIASVEAFRHTVDDLVSIVNYG